MTANWKSVHKAGETFHDLQASEDSEDDDRLFHSTKGCVLFCIRAGFDWTPTLAANMASRIVETHLGMNEYIRFERRLSNG